MAPQQGNRLGAVRGHARQLAGRGSRRALRGPSMAAPQWPRNSNLPEKSNSPRQATAQKFSSGIDNSRAMAVQRMKLSSLFASRRSFSRKRRRRHPRQMKEAPGAVPAARVCRATSSRASKIFPASPWTASASTTTRRSRRNERTGLCAGQQYFCGARAGRVPAAPGLARGAAGTGPRAADAANGRGLLNDDIGLEQEADEMGAQAVQMSAEPLGASQLRGTELRGVQREPGVAGARCKPRISGRASSKACKASLPCISKRLLSQKSSSLWKAMKKYRSSRTSIRSLQTRALTGRP